MPVKFLVVRFSSIGDIVLTTPVIRGLKTQVEDAEVHFVTKKAFLSVVANNPYIDKIHLFDNDLNALVDNLRTEEFDYIIDLHHNLRSFLLKRRLNIIAFSFNKVNFQKWLRVVLKIDVLPRKHIVDRYLETCYLFDVVNDGKGLDFFIDPSNEVNLLQLPESFRQGYVAMVIGAQHATKQMPDEKLGRLCSLLQYPVIILGGNDSVEKAKAIMNFAVGNGKNIFEIYDACGKFNLQQSASLVRQAGVVITHDTGLMHIAAAFHKPIVSLWGNTIPEFGMYPYVEEEKNFIFETKGLWCRPCSKIGYKKCPLGHFKCMNNIDVGEVARKCNQLMGYTP
ncbi:MAG: glycosyltransferase family 9 protein [Bacteroidales bacterium]|nr:glycosyltransferase family 9 protein [Bacteroidales bacterium]